MSYPHHWPLSSNPGNHSNKINIMFTSNHGPGGSTADILPECTNSLIQIEMISRLNNMGCACLEGESSDLSQAGNYFRRALAKANELMLFAEPSNPFACTTTSAAALAADPAAGNFGNNSNHSHHSASSFHLEDAVASKSRLYVYQRGEYDEGMHEYSTPITLRADMVSTKNATTTIVYNLGQLYLRLNNDDEALKSFLRALQLGQWGSTTSSGCGDCGRVVGDSQLAFDKATSGVVGGGANKWTHHPSSTGGVSLLAVLHNIGHVQYRNGHYLDAIKTYTNALELLRNSATSATTNTSGALLELAGTLNCLGVCNFHLPKADTDKALSYYREALTIRKAVLGQDAQTKEIATYINNIGRVYYLRGQHDAALECYNIALVIRRRLFGNDHLDVAAVIYNAGQTHHHRRELDQAMTLYKEFLGIAKNRLGYHHRDVAAMLKCMAQIKHECRDVDAATVLYREAIQVGRAALGPNHPEIASTLNKLGNLLYENSDLESAVQVYQEGLAVERAVLDHDHPNIVVTITNIAQIYKLQEKYDLALNLYAEAVAIQRRSLDVSHPGISTTLSSMALIYYRTRRFTKALEVYQEVLRIRRDAYGDIHEEIGATLNSLGLVLFKMDLHDFALASFHESLKIRKELLGEHHRDVAVVLYNLATCHLECGDDDQAMHYYRETLRVEKAALGDDHPDVVLTLLHCGQVLQGRGDLDEALAYYDEALEAQAKCDQKEGTTDHVTLARILNHKGNVFFQRGRAKEMVESLSKALRHLRAAGKKENELVVSGFNFYALAKNHPECPPAA